MIRFRPLRLNRRDCVMLIMLVVMNTVHFSNMANNNMDRPNKDSKEVPVKTHHGTAIADEYLKKCHRADEDCTTLHYDCVKCDRSIDCVYGSMVNYTCSVMPKIVCKGSKMFNRTARCRFCYQTDKWEHKCVQKASCNSLASPVKYYTTNCTVMEDVVCLGRRVFLKRVQCAWTGGARHSTALLLALTLGGFGADRFYLGHWQEGIGKLFSFGGLGVWTLVDALLIGIHHLGPADGSLYI